MKRKAFPIVIASILLLALLAACAPGASTPSGEPTGREGPAAKGAGPAPTSKAASQQPEYGGRLLLANKNEPAHFDMLQDTSIGIQLPLASAYSLLVQNDPEDADKIIGDLAKSWEVSPEGLTYSFYLVEGVRFHDGAVLTADDVKFNLDRIVFPPSDIISARKELFRSVDKIVAPDSLTVRVTLKYPQPSFLQLVAMPFNFVFSPEVIKRKGNMKRDVVGTGPFKFRNYVDRVSFNVDRNPDYFIKGRPYLDGITVYSIFDARTRIAALKTKQLHILPLSAELTPGEAAELKRTLPSLVSYERVQPSQVSIISNTQVKPWSDARVRRALSLVIDRELGGKVVRGGYFPGYGYTMPAGKWSLKDSELMAMPGFRKAKEQDVAEAVKLLAEAGYPKGFKSMMLAVPQAHITETAEFGKDQLTKAGMIADIEIVDSAAAKQRMLGGRFEMIAYNDSSATDDPDIVLGEYYLTGSAKNWGKWSNQQFDELYAQQSKALDAQKRLELVWEMQRLLHREAPRAIVAWARKFAVMWPEVKDWIPAYSHFLNNKFQDVWLDR